ncbi:MAG: ParB N-terminal domain-containing protein, partial [Frankiaceae bacterium]
MSADLAVRPDVVPSVRIAEIVVGERARKDYGDLTGLMESIREVGLLQPIGLAPGNRLLFGGRRLEACRRLGWESIPVTRPETRDDALSLLKAERDENTCRKDMTPEELVDLGLRLEELE